MHVKMAEDWKELLSEEFSKPYFEKLVGFLKEEYATRTVYPAGRNIFRAFDACPLSELKVVIIGQDPYHGPGQANGLCFSVNDNVPFPPSLCNIFTEIKNETGTAIPTTGNLERWARQGVLLLNAVMTVRAHAAASHQGKGWEEFTDAVVAKINAVEHNLVYLLWGAYAQRKGAMVDRSSNCVLESAHPSPLSAHRGFFGNGHFSKCNDYLLSIGKTPIVW